MSIKQGQMRKRIRLSPMFAVCGPSGRGRVATSQHNSTRTPQEAEAVAVRSRTGKAGSYTRGRHLVMKPGCILASALLCCAFALPSFPKDWLFVTTNWNEADSGAGSWY